MIDDGMVCGWVRKRPDGRVAKCGGPGMCDACTRALVKLWKETREAPPFAWALVTDVRIDGDETLQRRCYFTDEQSAVDRAGNHGQLIPLYAHLPPTP